MADQGLYNSRNDPQHREAVEDYRSGWHSLAVGGVCPRVLYGGKRVDSTMTPSPVSVAIGVVALAAVGLFAGVGVERVVGPDATPIVIHSLTFESTEDGRGRVIQERTITPPDGASAFYAFWQAEVVDADTGVAVEDCKGSDAWPYTAGHSSPPMSLARWTGGEMCRQDDLPDTFYLQATWFWGADQVTYKSDVYTTENTRNQ